jgi:hypothetical protein
MPKQETQITFSANETNLLSLKVARCVANNFDTDSLLQQITKDEYDICRLTVPAGDENAIIKLEKTGLPYYYSGSITRYKTRVSDLKANDFKHPDLEYEKYDGSQNDLLLKLLIGTWGTYPIGYYRTPFLNKLVTKEQEILCVFEFYKKHNLQKDYPNNTIMFIKHKENYVGFFALNIIDDRLESHIGGIVDPYRKDGYFFDMQEYIRRFCVENNLKYFAFGARNENRRVNEIFQKFGYVAIDADNVFHITPLLSYSDNKKNIRNEFLITHEKLPLIYLKILEIAQKNATEFLNHSAINYSFKINNLQEFVEGKYTTITSFPVISENENMIAIKIYNESNQLVSFAYLINNLK